MKLATKCAMLMMFMAAVMASTGAYAKKVKKNLYVFGCSASFTDSLVYITEIQVMENVGYDTKMKMLADRDAYSGQLKQYFADKRNQPHRTCLVMFSDNEKEINKKRNKLKTLYTVKSPGKYDVRYISNDEFSFTVIKDDEEESSAGE